MNKIIINYNVKEGFFGTILKETKEGIIPYRINNKDLTFIDKYPSLANTIKNGKTLFISSNEGFVGSINREGPYNEEEVLISEYDSKYMYLCDLFSSLEQKISNNKINIKRLVRIGDSYN